MALARSQRFKTFTEEGNLGLALAPMGRDVIITVVEPNSPAAAAGLKVGDKIVSINGRPATEAVAVGDGPVGGRVVVPDDPGLVVEARVENKDVGFVHAGQDAEIKVE